MPGRQDEVYRFRGPVEGEIEARSPIFGGVYAGSEQVLGLAPIGRIAVIVKPAQVRLARVPVSLLPAKIGAPSQCGIRIGTR